MGTRHKQTVISKTGELKIQQYGQWDGYPSGQGVSILEYLRKGDLEKYQNNLESIPLINEEQIKEVEACSDWDKKYPYLSRDCGAEIHQLIENGEVKFVSHIDENEARRWCEGFYTIDFSKGEFTSEFYNNKHTFNLSQLPTKEEYLKVMKSKDED